MSELTDAAAAAPRPIKGRTTAAPPPPPEPTADAYAAQEPPRPESALTGGPTGSAVAAPIGLYGEVEPAFQPGFQRKPFGTMEQKLAYPERPGYHRHWFNDAPDKPGRIEEAYNAGYTHVRDRFGRPVVRTVGRGGIKAYLMEIPAPMFLADMEAQERINRTIESAIKGGRLTNNPDEADVRYIPTDGAKRGIRFEDE